MPAGSDPRRPPPDTVQSPTFTVEHFGWGAPDRLEVAGTFTGLETSPPPDAVLTVFGDDGAHRLPAIEDGSREIDGTRLTASFAWVDTPVAFHHARLELGETLAVDFDDPDGAAGHPLPVERLGAPVVEAPPAREASPREPSARAIDAESAADRFHEGLALVRRSAEEAIEAANAARVEAEERSREEISRLRERIAELEPASAERDAARAELAQTHEELDAARGALSAARERAQELLAGLSDPATGRR